MGVIGRSIGWAKESIIKKNKKNKKKQKIKIDFWSFLEYTKVSLKNDQGSF